MYYGLKYFIKNYTEQRILIKKILLSMPKRTMPICFTKDQYNEVVKYAKKCGMLDPSQAVEEILEKNQ